MAAMAPRNNKKAQAIAWRVLGKPANMVNKRSERQEQIDRRIAYGSITYLGQ